MNKKSSSSIPGPEKGQIPNPNHQHPAIQGLSSRVIRKEKITTERRTTHTTNPHQSKTGSRRTDDR